MIIRRYKDGDHDITHIPGLFYRVDRSSGGHVRLFGKSGLVVYQYNRSNSFGFSDGYSWMIPGVVALCFNDTQGGTLRHCQKPGWSVRWTRFRLKNIAHGLQVTLRGPDTYVS